MAKRVYTRRPIADRLWEKVDRSGGPDACWPWTAARNYGYGIIGITTTTVDRATRVIWRLMNGPIPAGMFVCHHCDNPPCCNPKHLFVGTHRDNMADCKSKGRNWFGRGETGGNARLTEAQVLQIRAMSGTTHREIAKLFGLNHKYVGMILRRKYWKHI